MAPLRPADRHVIPGSMKRATQPATEQRSNGAAPAATAPQLSEPSGTEIWSDMLTEADGDLFGALTHVADRLESGTISAAAVAAAVDFAGPLALDDHAFIDIMLGAIKAPSHPAHLLALRVIPALWAECARAVEPATLRLLRPVLACAAGGDPAAAKDAHEAAQTMVDSAHPHFTAALMHELLSIAGGGRGGDGGGDWRMRAVALDLITARCKRYPVEAGRCAPEAIPILTAAAAGGDAEAGSAKAALLAACYAVNCRWLDPCVILIVESLCSPGDGEKIDAAVAKLAATAVDGPVSGPTLAVVAPLLRRALKPETDVETVVAACGIVQNVFGAVEDAAVAVPWVPVLLPKLAAIADGSDENAASEARRAAEILEKLKDDAEADTSKKISQTAAATAAAATLRSAANEADPGGDLDGTWAISAIDHIAQLASSLITAKLTGPKTWAGATVAPLTPLLGGDEDTAVEVTTALRRWALGYAGLEDSGTEDLATELCHCEFSLAYGGRILLTGAALHLLRGRRYGLCGPNGAGKTTLLKTIARGDLEGFPSKEELRSVYVGHDIDASTAAASAVDWIFEDPEVRGLKPKPPTRAEVESALEEMGFSATTRAAAVASLSGGWRMKLALARAAILRADILLLDEPTNHLDAANVAWLEDWLVAAPRVAAVVVSHDAPFLEAIATDIVNFETGKLVHYHGGLREFVAARPEAAAFLENGAGEDGAAPRHRGPAFVLPDPGYLDGIKTRSQPVMRLQDVSFSYPGAAAPLLNHVTLRASMGSRVAVTGANGAGKSTLVKLLIGELSPQSGGAWRHPNLRVAYVAQHAFHHIEDHLDRTPAEYFWWRFGGGDDREALRAIAAKVTPAAAAARDAAIARGERVVDYLNSRRMNGKTKEYEYEAAWVGQSSRQNSWLSLRELREVWGAEAMAEALDVRLAAFRTHRPLSTPVVTSHLAGFGLQGEVASATRIAGLSGGQKVRLVLAAAMWPQPHFLVLDEPTNYLDAGALGALATGIAGFRGGVLMITHHAAWAAALCTEEWVVQGGGVTVRPMGGEGTAAEGEVAVKRENGGADGSEEAGGIDGEDGEEPKDPAALEAELAARAARRDEKERIAAEKAAKKAERAKLRFSKKF